MKRPSPGPGWTVLVTGASSGLGRALALELARWGCSLVLTGRDAHRLAAVAAEARALAGGRVDEVLADLSVDGGVEALTAAVESLGVTVDALVNNAGAGRSGPWREATLGSDRALMRLLMEAPLALTRAYLPGWKERGRGALLNVASTGAFQPGPQTAVYYASKAFLMNWSVALAREEASWLTVTTLCPGALKTGFSAAAGKRDVPGAPGPDRTARVAVRAWKQNRGLVVPGLVNKMAVWVSRTVPPAWTAVGVEALQKSVQFPDR